MFRMIYFTIRWNKYNPLLSVCLDMPSADYVLLICWKFI